MAQNKYEVSIQLPTGLELTDQDLIAIRKVFTLRLAGVVSTSMPEKEPPLPETNIIIGQHPKKSAKKRYVKSPKKS